MRMMIDTESERKYWAQAVVGSSTVVVVVVVIIGDVADDDCLREGEGSKSKSFGGQQYCR